MKRITIALILVASLFVIAEAAAPKSPSEMMVEKILSDKNAALEKAEADYHKVVDPIIKKYSAIRDKAKDRAVKQAKLRLDLAKKQAVARKDDLAVAVIQNALTKLEIPVRNIDSVKNIVGQWHGTLGWGEALVTFEKNGSGSVQWVNKHKTEMMMWKIEKDCVIQTHSNGNWRKFLFPIDPKGTKVVDKNGRTYIVKKVK